MPPQQQSLNGGGRGPLPPPNGVPFISVDGRPVLVAPVRMPIGIDVQVIEGRKVNRDLRRQQHKLARKRYRRERRAYRKNHPWSERHVFGGRVLWWGMILATLLLFVFG